MTQRGAMGGPPVQPDGMSPSGARSPSSRPADNEILRSVVGSGLHGIAIEGTDDHDEMGVFVEPARVVLGFGRPMDGDEQRTQPQGVRSGPGDTDLVRYSLRKYVRLAVQGNPTILLPLYAPESALLIRTDLGDELRAMRRYIVSRQAIPRFLGYLDGQLQSMLGLRKRPNRPELVERYGYDTKFASHALRLAIQGNELVSEGLLHLPMKPEHRDLIRFIKTGGMSKDEVLGEVRRWEGRLRDAARLHAGPLREEPDRPAIEAWMVGAHLQYWAGHPTAEQRASA